VGVIVALDLTVVSINDLRKNPLEEMVNDTIHARVGQLDSFFGLIFYNV
jgi:hypothetical protein